MVSSNEVAHIERRGLWADLLQRVIEAAFSGLELNFLLDLAIDKSPAKAIVKK